MDTALRRSHARRCVARPTGDAGAHAATIRNACATLGLLPPDVLPAASVTGRLTGGAAEARRLAVVSRQEAERAGLVADVVVDGELFHVRFRRAAPAAPARESGPADWLRLLLRRYTR